MPVGIIDLPDGSDIEIIFLHYHTPEEAISKWQRRCSRINFDKLVVLGTDNDRCSKSDVEAFLKLPYANKFFFSAHDFGITDSPEYAFIPEMKREGKVDGYNKAHILYRYLTRLKYKK